MTEAFKMRNQEFFKRKLLRTALLFGIVWGILETPLVYGQGRRFLTSLPAAVPTAANVSAEPVSDDASLASALQISEAFRKASRAVIPCVVKVIVKSGVDQSAQGENQTPEKKKNLHDLLPDFSGQAESIEGVGSGALVDPRGIVLTNHHVVAESQNISVELYDGRQFKVKSVNKDSLSDLAVLTLDTQEELPYLKFADSDLLQIGDWVLAIGNPFMLDSSVSAGIISAKDRSLKDKDRGCYLQTDAAINPGNSGGPLVNLKGEVVGINTAIATLSGGYQGIGFAIPSNTALWIMNQLTQNGKVQRAFLGVPAKAIPYEEGKKLGLGPREGVKTQAPFKNSPAAKAGVRSNDILLRFDDKPIRSEENLQNMVECANISVPHTLTILRKGESERRILSVQLEIQPENYIGVPQSENLVEKGKHFNDRELGLVLIPLTPDAAARLGVSAETGLVVLSAFPGGAAYRAGIRDGSLMTKLNGQPVLSLDQYAELRKENSLETGIEVEIVSKKHTEVIRLSK